LEQGTPEPFPISYGPVRILQAVVWHVSVSRLEVVDAVLHQSSGVGLNEILSDATLSAEDATRLGTLTHAVIERLEPGQPEQAHRFVKTVLADQTPQVREKLQPLIEHQIAAWYASDLCQILQTAKVHYRELDFLLHWPAEIQQPSIGAVTVSGTIDALVQTQTGDWMLFDYKTGPRMARMTEEQLIAEYEFQLGVYTLAVKQLIGSRPASIGLAVVHDSVRYVEWDPDEKQLDQITDRLSAAVSSLNQPTPATESR